MRRKFEVKRIFRRADHSKREEAQIELMRLVQQVFDDSSQRFGAKKIRATLAESGVRVGTKRIAAIMQELGLQSIRSDAKKQYKKQQQYKKQEILGHKDVAVTLNTYSHVASEQKRNALITLGALCDG